MSCPSTPNPLNGYFPEGHEAPRNNELTGDSPPKFVQLAVVTTLAYNSWRLPTLALENESVTAKARRCQRIRASQYLQFFLEPKLFAAPFKTNLAFLLVSRSTENLRYHTVP